MRLHALQAVAKGYRAPTRSVQIREDRSITLHRSLREDPKTHDGLGERVKRYSRSLRKDPNQPEVRAELTRLSTELALRQAGTPTQGFQI